MACTISTSKKPDCVWMIKSSIYEWFIKLIIQRYKDDVEVSSHLTKSVYTNGISLDLLYEKDPDLTRRIVTALKVIAKEVADGKYTLRTEDGLSSSEIQHIYNLDKTFYNSGPFITYFIPAENPSIPEGDAVNLSVSCYDYSGDLINVIWFVDSFLMDDGITFNGSGNSNWSFKKVFHYLVLQQIILVNKSY